VFCTNDKNRTTDENERCVQVLVILSGVIPVEFFRFFAVHGEEVGARVIGSQRVEEFLEGGLEAGPDVSYDLPPHQCNGLGAPLWIYLDNRWLLRLRLFTLAGGRVRHWWRWWWWWEGASRRRLPSYQSRSTIFLGGMVTTSERRIPLRCKHGSERRITA